MSRQQTPNRDLASDAARANHSVNGLLNNWQRTVAAYTADGPAGPDWLFISKNGTDTVSCTQNTAQADTANGAEFALACAFVLGTGAGLTGIDLGSGGGTPGFKLTTDRFRFFRSRQVTISWRVRWSGSNTAVRLSCITNGTGGASSFSAYHTGDDTWQTLTITSPVIPADATTLRFRVVFAVTGTYYIGAHATVLGIVAADPYIVALHPADDLARCLRYYETTSSLASFSLIGQARSGVNAGFPWVFKVRKAVIPIITFAAGSVFQCTSAAGTGINGTAVGVYGGSSSLDSTTIDLTVASGLVAGNASILLATLGVVAATAEANP